MEKFEEEKIRKNKNGDRSLKKLGTPPYRHHRAGHRTFGRGACLND
jgi:hypothetical protein